MVPEKCCVKHHQCLYTLFGYSFFPPANTALASMDTSTVIGITFAISFVMFSLVVLVAVCVCCLVKQRSKVILRHPATKPSTHNMIETDQKDTITDIGRDITMETNCVYAVPADLSDYYI